MSQMDAYEGGLVGPPLDESSEVTVTTSEDLGPPPGLPTPDTSPYVLRGGYGDVPWPTPSVVPGRRVSTAPVLVMGIDPGATTGIAYVTWYPRTGWSHRQKAFELPAERAAILLAEIIPALRARKPPWILATEKFIHRRRSGKLKRPTHAAIPTELNQAITMLGESAGWKVRKRRKVDVNDWADENRLRAAGLWEPTRGKRHARDAAQHGLYAAVMDGYAMDPLLKWCEPCQTMGLTENHDHAEQ